MTQVNSVEANDPRTDDRSNVFLTAVMSKGTASWRVRIRNVSTQGALLDGSDLPDEGTIVYLRRGHLSAEGEIAWQRENQRGFRFIGSVEVDEWLKRVGHAGQQRVDQDIAQVRATLPVEHGGFPTPPHAPEALKLISAEFDRACERPSSLPSMTIEMAEQLLRFDAIAQRLRNYLEEHGI